MINILKSLVCIVISLILVTHSNFFSVKIYISDSMRRQKRTLEHIAEGKYSIRLITPRFKETPTDLALKPVFSFIARQIYSLGNRKSLHFVHWGYSDKQRFGFSFSEFGYETSYTENTLLGFAENGDYDVVGYLIDSRAPYFDGRLATDLEQMLNDQASGVIERRNDLKDFVAAAKASSLQKFPEYNKANNYCFRRDDVVVVGQVPGDAAWTQTDCVVVDNIDLIRVAQNHLKHNSKLYYKAHPRNHLRKKEHNQICELFPDIIEIPPEVSLKSIFKSHPKVVVNTYGAGLDAGLEGCEVHSYGVSFYAGWGATIDHFPKVKRRKAKLSFDEIFAVTLGIYTKYFCRNSNLDVSVPEVTEIIRETK